MRFDTLAFHGVLGSIEFKDTFPKMEFYHSTFKNTIRSNQSIELKHQPHNDLLQAYNAFTLKTGNQLRIDTNGGFLHIHKIKRTEYKVMDIKVDAIAITTEHRSPNSLFIKSVITLPYDDYLEDEWALLQKECILYMNGKVANEYLLSKDGLGPQMSILFDEYSEGQQASRIDALDEMAQNNG